jgi:hypothetical protein
MTAKWGPQRQVLLAGLPLGGRFWFAPGLVQGGQVGLDLLIAGSGLGVGREDLVGAEQTPLGFRVTGELEQARAVEVEARRRVRGCGRCRSSSAEGLPRRLAAGGGEGGKWKVERGFLDQGMNSLATIVRPTGEMSWGRAFRPTG